MRARVREPLLGQRARFLCSFSYPCHKAISRLPVSVTAAAQLPFPATPPDALTSPAHHTASGFDLYWARTVMQSCDPAAVDELAQTHP